MERLEFYKDIYNNELERKIELDNSLSLPIILLTAICTSIFYFTTHFDYKYNKILTVFFILLLLIALSFIVVTIYQLIRSYNNYILGYPYHYLPYCADIEKYYIDLIKYHKEEKKKTEKKAKEEAGKITEDYLITEYILNTDNNIYNNDKRQSHLHKAKIFLIFSLIITILLVIPFEISYFINKDKEKITNVKILNTVEVNHGEKAK